MVQNIDIQWIIVQQAVFLVPGTSTVVTGHLPFPSLEMPPAESGEFPTPVILTSGDFLE